MPKGDQDSKEHPIVELLDSLGRRWSLRIIWELQEGPVKFRALRKACDGVSPSVLNTRVRELRRLELIKKSDHGYALTPDGKSLAAHLSELDRWARRWRKRHPDTSL